MPSPDTEPKRPTSKDPWRVEGAPKASRRGSGWSRNWRFWAGVLVLLTLNFWIGSLVPDKPERLAVPYTFFVSEVERGNVEEISAQGDDIQGTFKRAAKPADEDSKARRRFSTFRPEFDDNGFLDRLLRDENVVVNAKPLDQGRPLLFDVLLFFGPTLLLVGLFVMIARRGAGGMSGLGRSRAKRYESSEQRVSFDDVAGIDEAEDELVEIVDFLRKPGKYRALGAMVPRGVLLSGPPGTGKTLLARAVAGEADVPFFSISASEFIEMVVGVGASRVRDLFDQAKKVAPAIIFIDELDAIGRQRGSGAAMGGHDEREQTLNQILTEMDGFSGSEGVIVLAATNRPDILDSALLRPGRFDRRISVNPPDQEGRTKILEVHTRSVPLDDDVDLSAIASTTPGMVGADLRNLINEAALQAAREGHARVTAGDFYNAFERVVLGAERRITISAEERERTAWHEAGHALLGMLVPGADPVRKVSIVPRGRALGVTFQSPDFDRYGYDVAYLEGRIVGTLGGRAAEELVFGNVTSGAQNDLEQVTSIARSMVGRWGMSEAIGPIAVTSDPATQAYPGADGTSEATRELVDQEVRRIIERCYGRALDDLRESRDRLDALAHALLERETLDEDAAYQAAGFQRGKAPGDTKGLPGAPADRAAPAPGAIT